MRRLLLLALPAVLTLSACSSSRNSSRYPGSRTIPTPSGNVIVMPDGTIYRDRDGDGVADRDEGIDRDGDGRTTICHKGRTQTVGTPAVRAHLRHGDYVGSCDNRNGTYDRNGRVDRDDDDDDDDRRERGQRVERDDDRRERGQGQNRNRGKGRGRGND